MAFSRSGNVSAQRISSTLRPMSSRILISQSSSLFGERRRLSSCHLAVNVRDQSRRTDGGLIGNSIVHRSGKQALISKSP
jgi:hypothetical protein